MSASIFWIPVDPAKDQRLSMGAPSAFIVAMERAGLAVPCDLSGQHLETLKGMAALFGEGDERPNPYQQIVDAIREHGRIKVWAEY